MKSFLRWGCLILFVIPMGLVVLFGGFVGEIPTWVSLLAWVVVIGWGWRRWGQGRGAGVGRRLPVYGSYAEAESDVDFRFADDPPHVIRVAQGRPFVGASMVETSVPVKGVTFDGRQRYVARFAQGRGRRVHLRHEPMEGHPDAVAVVGEWLEGAQPVQAQLGYLPSGTGARFLTEEGLMVAATVSSLYLPVGEQSAGVRVTLWA